MAKKVRPKAVKKQAARKTDAVSDKMALAKERLGLEVKSLADLIAREITNAGEWPPAPEISEDIRRRSMALGARAVKLLDAVDKLELARNHLEGENEDLSSQVHELRMKSSGISPAELAHLKMENQVLKDHVSELENALSGGAGEEPALQAENATLKAQLKELEEEVNRLLGSATEADQVREDAERINKELEAARRELETVKKSSAGQAGVLASVWAEGANGEGDEDTRVAALREQVAALEAENDQLMEKGRKRLEEVKNQRDDLAQKVVDLAESSAERAEHAIEQILELQKERDDLKERLMSGASLEPDAVPGQTIRDDAITDLKKIIKSLESHIGELEEELDTREDEIAARNEQLKRLKKRGS
ncbi:MAG: hypothetical protein ACYS47_15705 [Planctomycetota bacterium]|jgi:chromosome segregation ATPase